MGNQKSLPKPTYEDISASIAESLALRQNPKKSTTTHPKEFRDSACDLRESWETIYNNRDVTSWEYNLCSAVSSGSVAELNRLQENNRNIIKVTDRFGYSLLHLSVWHGQEDLTEHLLAHLDVDIRSFDDWTPLHSASRKGLYQMAELLLLHGASPTAQSACGWTPLHYAAWTGHGAVTRLLLDLGADANIAAASGWTCLHYASWKGSARTVKELLRHGAEVNTREATFGRTALHFAIECRSMDVISALLKADANVNLQDNRGTSAFRFAHDSNVDITSLLLENVVGLEVTDQASYRFVERAMSLNVPDVLRCLIGKKAGDSTNAELTAEYLEAALDDCIGVDGNTIYINYGPLLPRNFQNFESILPIFLCISKEHKFERLLLHPTIRTYLIWKWGQVSKYFYTNLGIFTVACANLLTYQFLFYSQQRDLHVLGYVSYSLMGIACGILIIRELAQLHINWTRHLKDVENYCELSLIAYMLLILCWYPDEMSPRTQLMALGNILLAVNLTLLIGHHPAASSAVHLLRTVTYKFTTYFLVYLLIILAFSLSFYQLHGDSGKAPTDGILSSYPVAVLRTMGMFIGELNLDDLLAGKCSFVLVILLAVFLLYVSVIILNLLNGIAVSNILDKYDLDICRSKSELEYLHNLSGVLNMVFGVMQKAKAAPLSRPFGRNMGNVFILRDYISYKELHIHSGQYHLHSNELHKEAYDILKKKTARGLKTGAAGDAASQNADERQLLEKMAQKIDESNKLLTEINNKLTAGLETC